MEKLKKQEMDAHSLYALNSNSKDTQRTLLPLTHQIPLTRLLYHHPRPLTSQHKDLNQHVDATVKLVETNVEKEAQFSLSRSLEFDNGDFGDATEPLFKVDKFIALSMPQLRNAASHSTHNDESHETIMQDLTCFLDDISSDSV